MKACERNEKFAAAWAAACEAGDRAAAACRPAAMIVEQHADMTDDSSPVKRAWIVPGGPCGFAWISIHPANSSFGLWAKKTFGLRRSYGGGLTISSKFSPGNSLVQSLALNEAWCHAAVESLRASGVLGNARVYAESRID
jgi:hypothetical protein